MQSQSLGGTRASQQSRAPRTVPRCGGHHLWVAIQKGTRVPFCIIALKRGARRARGSRLPAASRTRARGLGQVGGQPSGVRGHHSAVAWDVRTCALRGLWRAGLAETCRILRECVEIGGNRRLVAFSLLFNVNILMSNVSLNMVSMVRASPVQ